MKADATPAKAAAMAFVDKAFRIDSAMKIIIEGKYEVMDILMDKLSMTECIGFLKGNILKYIMRLGKKENDLDDSRKAMWYLVKLIQMYDKEKTIIDTND